ncbi:ABC transporter permease [Aurantiacibacter xanthus]|uniref:ABC transporter permease n=1 Tax=Aurantiacibacter xanthus TaxID=1784712 RepID=A0A3A1PDI2_9SPHN|nr:ABC transporter permease [Aurantiacibacter xanthus]RIV91819.1 ABC transporter permease [Aurantiacibacter xanthus]
MSAGQIDPRRLRAMVVKEGVQILRDPSTILIALALPVLLLFLFGYAINLDNARTHIGLAVQDDSAAAQSLALAYQHSPYFAVTTARTVAPLRARMIAGEIRGIVVIPQDFGSGAARGHRPPIQIIADGSQPNAANFTTAYARGVAQTWAAQEAEAAGLRAPLPTDMSLRFWYNPSLASRNFLVPGAIAIVMTMIGTLLTSLVIAREWERGTMEAMMATPMRMSEFLISKIVPYFLLALASMAMCTLLATLVFGVPLRGSLPALLLLTVAYLMPALGQGLFISAATKNQFVASQIALLSGFLPTFLLSGFLFEIASMPKWIQAITYIVPARYFIPALQTVFLAGDIWAVILPAVACLLGFGAIFFLLCFRSTRRSLDK